MNGNGIKFLKNKDIKVTVGVLEKECKNLHRNFLHFNSHKRPYIILKWAQTLDNFIAPTNKSDSKPFWISSIKSRKLVHKWRSEEHAILIGYNTALSDNPSLTVRHVKGNNPIRIILDDKNSLDKDLNVFNGESETLVIENFLKENNKISFGSIHGIYSIDNVLDFERNLIFFVGIGCLCIYTSINA